MVLSHLLTVQICHYVSLWQAPDRYSISVQHTIRDEHKIWKAMTHYCHVPLLLFRYQLLPTTLELFANCKWCVKVVIASKLFALTGHLIKRKKINCFVTQIAN